MGKLMNKNGDMMIEMNKDKNRLIKIKWNMRIMKK